MALEEEEKKKRVFEREQKEKERELRESEREAERRKMQEDIRKKREQGGGFKFEVMAPEGQPQEIKSNNEPKLKV